MRSIAASRFLFGSVAMLSAACACQRQASPGGPSPSQSAPGDLGPTLGLDETAATIGDSKITMREVEDSVSPQIRELAEQAYDIRRQGLDQLINQSLVKKAAFAQGLSEEQYLQEAVDKKTAAPSAEEVKKFYDQNAAQLPPGAKFDDFKDRITTFLKRQQQSERAKEVFGELRKDSKVEVMLKAPPKPRVSVAAVGPSRGPASAKVTIVEFSDFECPFCSRARTVVDEVVKKYDGKIRLVFRQFPLSFHAHAKKAAEASLCANAQDKFWAYHDGLFDQQKDLDEASLKKLAGKLGLDQAKFDACLAAGEMGKQLAEDLAEGQKAGVTGTPAFFVNGIALSGALPADEFARVIDAELAGN